MSNDTQVQAHIALVRNHIELVKERARYDVINRSMAAVEASARQLAEQPGFVMVPVEDMAELREALDICVSLLESAKSNHLPRIIAAYSKADAIVKAETCDCPAKDMPFGRCCKARPLTASPTAPSIEQRPQNCGTGFCSCIECPYETPTAPTAVEPDERVEAEKAAFESTNETANTALCKHWFRKGFDAARASKGTPL